jgi:hypothetical protein
LWVKQTGVEGARFTSLKGVELLQTVDDFTARWVAEELPGVRPSLVTLKLAPSGSRKPTPAEEDAASVLDDPSLSLAESGVTGTAWLLAFVAGLAPASPGETDDVLHARPSFLRTR